MNLSKSDTTKRLRTEFLWRLSKATLLEKDITWCKEHTTKLIRIPIYPLLPDIQYVWQELTTNLPVLARAIPDLEPLASLILEKCHEQKKINDKVLMEQTRILRLLHENAIQPTLLKGASVRALLGCEEGMNDTDILLADFDTMVRVLGVSERAGYHVSGIRLQLGGTESAPVLVGNCDAYLNERGRSTRIQSDWDKGWLRTLDVHLGALYVVGTTTLKSDIIVRAVDANLDGIPVKIPCLHDMLLIEFAHLTSHGTLSMRGVNRCYRLLNIFQEKVDLDVLAAEIVESSLQVHALAVLDLLKTDFEFECPLRDAFHARGGRLSKVSEFAIDGLVGARSVSRYGAGTLASSFAQTLHYFNARKQENPLGRFVSIFPVWLNLFRQRKQFPLVIRPWVTRRLGWVTKRQPYLNLIKIDDTALTFSGKRHTSVQFGNRRCDLTWVGQNVVLIAKGKQDEILMTPIGTFTSAGYDGELDAKSTRHCETLAGIAHRYFAESTAKSN